MVHCTNYVEFQWTAPHLLVLQHATWYTHWGIRGQHCSDSSRCVTHYRALLLHFLFIVERILKIAYGNKEISFWVYAYWIMKQNLEKWCNVFKFFVSGIFNLKVRSKSLVWVKVHSFCLSASRNTRPDVCFL